jgi:hypothetical protein
MIDSEGGGSKQKARRHRSSPLKSFRTRTISSREKHQLGGGGEDGDIHFGVHFGGCVRQVMDRSRRPALAQELFRKV